MNDFIDAGLALVQHFEGCLEPAGDGRFKAYADPAHGWKVPTIGWGTIAYENGQTVKRGDIITQDRADELLRWELNLKGQGVAKLVKVAVTDAQFSALVCFAYNVGLGNLKSSTLLKLLNAGDYKGAAGQFIRWNKAAGKVLDGLTRRRMSEARLFQGFANPVVSMTEFRKLKSEGKA